MDDALDPRGHLAAASTHGGEFDAVVASGTAWMPHEDALIRVHYPVDGTATLATLLGRSHRTINQRAHRLNVDPPRAWSTHDLDVVREFYPAGGAAAVEARLQTHRTFKAISLVAKRLGLTAANGRRSLPGFSPGSIPSNRKGWSAAEDDLLQRLAPHKPLKSLHTDHFSGQPFERTYAAVAQRISALGLTTARIPLKGVSAGASVETLITRPMLDEIRSMVLKQRTLREIADAFPSVELCRLAEHYKSFRRAALSLRKRRSGPPAPPTADDSLPTIDRQTLHAEVTEVLDRLARESRTRSAVSGHRSLAELTASDASTIKLVAALRRQILVRPCLIDAIDLADWTPEPSALCPYQSHAVRLAAAHQLGDFAQIVQLIEVTPRSTEADRLARELGLVCLASLDYSRFLDYVMTARWLAFDYGQTGPQSSVRWFDGALHRVRKHARREALPEQIARWPIEILTAALHLSRINGDNNTRVSLRRSLHKHDSGQSREVLFYADQWREASLFDLGAGLQYAFGPSRANSGP
jgi:hypothetical protein